MGAHQDWGPVGMAVGVVGLLALAVAAPPVPAQHGFYRPLPVHTGYEPHWGCFGYCNHPINPPAHPVREVLRLLPPASPPLPGLLGLLRLL